MHIKNAIVMRHLPHMITRQSLRPLSAVASRRWTCPACSQTLTAINPKTQPPRRSLYTVPSLPSQDQFRQTGVKNLFSGPGFTLGWTRYQELMIKRLNELTAGRSTEGKDVRDLALRFAHNPATASAFNHASMAHNNHFFYEQFSPEPRSLSEYHVLQRSLIHHFGSIETLKMNFIDTAASMFGPGFVWLVWARESESFGQRKGSWKILCTYNAGTPYSEAGFMQQGLDMNTNNSDTFADYKSSLTAGFMGAYAQGSQQKAKLPPGGTSVLPVLCVSTWEHTYIYDFGLNRKVDYLNKFWDAIDWKIVDHRSPSEDLTRLAAVSR